MPNAAVPVRVLHVSSSINVSRGMGPADALIRLGRAHGRLGLGVVIVAPDRPGEVEEAKASLESAGVTVRLAPEDPDADARSAYFSALRQEIDRADVVHIHGMWLKGPHLAAREARRSGKAYIFRPCGMLEPWAMSQKRLKKRAFLALKGWRDLRGAEALHATGVPEAANLRRLGLRNRVVTIGNGVDLESYSPHRHDAEVEARWPELSGVKRLLLLSRIDPVKGTMELAEAWGRLADRHPEWRLVIAGPDWKGHKAEFESALERRGVRDRTFFTGPVYDDEKRWLLSSCDVFVQPSLQENFGITIAEALASARPVVTSRGTPWSELPERGCGWWSPHGADALAAALGEAMALSDAERDEMGRRARSYMESMFSWPALAQRWTAAYAWVLGRGPVTPDCAERDAAVAG